MLNKRDVSRGFSYYVGRQIAKFVLPFVFWSFVILVALVLKYFGFVD